MTFDRRTLLIGLVAAPAIVRFSSLMPVRSIFIDRLTDFEIAAYGVRDMIVTNLMRWPSGKVRYFVASSKLDTAELVSEPPGASESMVFSPLWH